jgi:hypothetical protein
MSTQDGLPAAPAPVRDVHISEVRPREECYPKRDQFIWNEFALGAVEMGGYNDITFVDPYTGRRFWMGHAFVGAGGEKLSMYDALRRLVDAMEAEKFLG